MTLWEFSCAIEGFKAASSAEDPAPPSMTDDQLAQLGIEGF